MASRAAAILAKVARNANAGIALSDHVLLSRYAESGDQAAFAAVVTRHTAMVHAVCRRVLHSQVDAEDASQAVFLMLSTKAKTISLYYDKAPRATIAKHGETKYLGDLKIDPQAAGEEN